METIINLLIPLAKSAFEAVQKAIAAGRASGELTEAQADAYRANIDEVFSKDYAKTDKQRGGS